MIDAGGEEVVHQCWWSVCGVVVFRRSSRAAEAYIHASRHIFSGFPAPFPRPSSLCVCVVVRLGECDGVGCESTAVVAPVMRDESFFCTKEELPCVRWELFWCFFSGPCVGCTSLPAIIPIRPVGRRGMPPRFAAALPIPCCGRMNQVRGKDKTR